MAENKIDKVPKGVLLAWHMYTAAEETAVTIEIALDKPGIDDYWIAKYYADGTNQHSQTSIPRPTMRGLDIETIKGFDLAKTVAMCQEALNKLGPGGATYLEKSSAILEATKKLQYFIFGQKLNPVITSTAQINNDLNIFEEARLQETRIFKQLDDLLLHHINDARRLMVDWWHLKYKVKEFKPDQAAIREQWKKLHKAIFATTM